MNDSPHTGPRTGPRTTPLGEPLGEPLSEAEVDAYLHRLDARRPAGPDRAALRELHQRHLRHVPFENLSVHLGEEIRLDPSALVDKLTRARRGGFCYELNGAFGALLTTLGYPVTLLAARVHGEHGYGPLFDHLALRVDTPEPWLVDVGFGRHSEFPLRLDERGDQPDPGGVFRVEQTPDGDLDVLRDGVPQYRIETRPRALADFEIACWWQRTSPKSHFTQSLVCSLLTDTGRITLSDHTLVTTGAEGRRQTELPDEALLDAYRDLFGITLAHPPTLRPALPWGSPEQGLPADQLG
ncbi:arylamine N-acetyltransferase [Streptacidiphilus sp. P02-A3a]|uniref:arylamine N-acetyltransferase family protein n=1 Tax=Streptacidiphilus sp. P02-A3a TaxID=2704468 RepID=UPI0015F9EE8E|nr:arylamine N-acetyltransferase [Streptacidiphilus sp. P02-A3a]QMU72780.1 arylamine N-acetyltransferase [Streptacidiphilus sp. P02-A3a]